MFLVWIRPFYECKSWFYSLITHTCIADRNQEKEQSLEKLLQSDLYPPIQYSKDMKSTFVVGGKGRLTSTTYSISSESLRKWFLKNQIESSYPVL